ncbi:MAG: T9SS type A sorting domain-containing protein [Crocinitomicaceae bacterium]|nr:T9SS type A sorting domain-containing protein [Crocinitomicaceae bacterium]
MTVSTNSFAQHDVHYCHSNEKMDEIKLQNPALYEQMELENEQLEQWTAHYIQNEYDPSARTAIYTIPVVFHVLHTNGPENISDAQIYSALELMNDNFNKLNPSWMTVNPAFSGIVADCQIEFKLAKKKHNGQCTNGITRTFTESTNNDSGDDQVDAVFAAQGNWPGNKYLNIYVVNDAGGAAGYTTYPAFGGTGMGNGIKILHNYVGEIGTSSPSVSTSLTHEIGHWLNLPHCWGSTNEPGLASNCSSDDGVADTPNTIGWTICNVNGVSCSSLDNVENYMEYSYCSKMYTEGQKARMHAALNSSTGGRSNLSSPGNLTATGVNLPDVLCQVNFSADRTEICAGESVTFTDESYSLVTGTNWTFTGGSPANSIAPSPTIVYNTPGVYAVSLQATDGSSTLTQTKTSYIIVLANPGESLPYSEGFENLSAFPDNQNFTRSDDDGDEAWEITTTASSSGDKSVWLNNYGASEIGTKDAFTSGPIDLSGVDPADPIVFNFRYAYRKISDSDDEWLRFYISKDCGATWVLRKNLHGDGLSEFTNSSSYLPSDESAWYSVSVTNINSDYYVSNMRFKFEFESDGGNNIYIDDINLYPASMTSIEEDLAPSGLSIYPNPVTDFMQVNFTTQVSGDYAISILNTLGQVIGTVYLGELQAGDNQLGYSTAHLPQGVYFLRVESQGNIATQKFVKN